MNRVFPCPSCGLSLSVAVAASKVRVVCPQCDSRIELSPGCPPTRSEPTDDVFAELPEPIHVSRDVAGPAQSRRARKRIASSSDRGAAGQALRRRMIRGLIALSAFAVAATGGIVAYDYIRRVPHESWAEAMPWMDSPDKILTQYDNIASSFLEVCESIDDEAARDASISEINVMAARLRGLSERAVAMHPLTDLQRETLPASYKDDVVATSRQVAEMTLTMRGKPRLLSAKFHETLHDMSVAVEHCADTIVKVWAP